MKLYCFGESGNSYKAALTLALVGVDWEPVFVDFFNGEARTDAYRDGVNEMGEVPVLVDGDIRLTQSGAIQQYVVDKTGHALGGAPADRYEIMRWVLWDNHKMSSQAGVTRFMMNFLPEDKRSPEVIAFLQGRLMAALKVLEHHLSDRDWIVGDGVTLADVSCCGYLYYPEPFGFDRSAWPKINAWLSRLSETPGWKQPYDLMPGHPSDRA